MKKVGVVFSGFGSQFVGMAKDVYDGSRVAQEYFEEAYNCLNVNFVKLCFASSDEELSLISNAYLAVFLADISLYSLLSELGIKPAVLTGYGMGCYAAWFVAGGFTLPDAFYLLNKYAVFYQEFLEQQKLQVIQVTGLAVRKARTLCQEVADDLFVAIVNAEADVMIAGSAKSIKKMEQILQPLVLAKEINLQARALGWGLHSELAAAVLLNFKMYLEKVDFKDLQIPVISNVNGKVIHTSKEVKKELVAQELNPLLWLKVVQGLADCDVIVEVGPGNQLAQQIQDFYPDKKVFALNKKEDLVKIKEAIGLNLQDSGYEA